MTIRPKSPQNKPDLTAERLREQLNYCPKTGVFTWRISRGPAQPGRQAKHKTAGGYVAVRIDYRLHMAHRLAWLYMTGDWPPNEIDHINCIRDDNKWKNLRLATSTENSQNYNMRSDNTSGARGVTWDRNRNKWTASIEVTKKYIYLGRFTDKSDAIAARHAAEIEHFGEFRHQPALDS